LETGPVRFVFDRIRVWRPDQKNIVEVSDIIAKLGIGMHKGELMC